MLDLSRIEAGQFKLDTLDFNFQHCLEDAVELCAAAGYRKGLEVNLIAAPIVPIGVKGDPMRLRQIVINLVGNAVKFTDAGEVNIRVGCTPDPESGSNRHIIGIEISDTGIGIDKAAISRLFEPFAQADSSISRKFGGTGLGLSITRHLVELMGGSVSLTSKKGVGTTVTVTLPFEATAMTSEPSILAQVSLAGLRALVVDDRPSTRELILSCLNGTGIAAVAATGEDEALRHLSEAEAGGRPFDVCIVDRTRPRTSGMHHVPDGSQQHRARSDGDRDDHVDKLGRDAAGDRGARATSAMSRSRCGARIWCAPSPRHEAAAMGLLQAFDRQ